MGGAGGGAGMGGMAGAGGGTMMPPPGTPGVVVAIDDMGTQGCVPLCTMATHPDDEDPADDWAWEGWACVLPDSTTGTRNQDCQTGMPLPPVDRNGLEGVVVDSDGDMMKDCVPLCEPGAMPGSAEAPDWGWEYQASCVIRGTPTGECNQGCTTGQPIPDPTLVQRPGVLRDEGCVAVCECGVAGDDPAWGWEFQTTCVMPGGEAATGLPACTTNDNTMLLPPAVTGATKPGFYTENGKLYDAKGAEFVMRGINNPHIWFDAGNQYRAYQALDRIATYKTNTIRVVWETEGGSAALLRQILYRIVQLKMVPVVELHDVTGSNNTADLARMATYYTQADVKQVLADFRAYVLVNIANEWGSTDNVNGYQSAYASAISTLRTAGIEHTLVIDADGFGQNPGAIFNNAAALLNGDPQKNLLFSLHMYSRFGSNAQVDSALDNAAIGTSIPFIVGEFGPVLQGQPVAWQQILTKSQARKIGYLAWSWSGNDSATAALNIVNDFGGDLTPSWGQQVMVSHAASIQNTAAKASIFN
jgi:mannan endo-1,4-beta-mannosidase